MSKYPTVDEVISLLRHSDLPTIITEGRDDYVVFRRLEDDLADHSVSVLPVGCRDSVLEIFDRRDECGRGGDLAFIADKDMWVFGAIPEQYVNDRIAFSHGYSVENDVFVDGDLLGLMRDSERAAFKAELETYLEWFALAARRYLNGEPELLDVHPNRLLGDAEYRAALCQLNEGEDYPSDVLDRCRSDFQELLRGKALMALATRQLSRSDRNPKHSKHALMELASVRRGPRLGATKTKVAMALGIPV